MKQGFMRNWSDLRTQLAAALIALFGLVTVGTIVYHTLEKWSWLVSFYFSVCTLTTVGYGDYYPTTDAARLFTALYVLVGVTVAFGAFSLIGAGYLNRSQQILQRISELESRSGGKNH
jgi:voltage-gated potassium channel